MPLVIPPDFAHIVWNHIQPSGRPFSVTFGVKASGNAGAIAPVLLAAGDAWNTQIVPLLDSSVTFSHVYALYNSGGTMVSGERPYNTVGASAITAPPPNWCLLVKKQTEQAGRQHRGRMYVPFLIGEAAIDEAGTVTGALTTYQTAFEDLIIAMQGSTPGVVLDPFILHSEPSIGAPPAPTPIVTVQVVNQGATQRRRMRS